jgi:hypothetical protein
VVSEKIYVELIFHSPNEKGEPKMKPEHVTPNEKGDPKMKPEHVAESIYCIVSSLTCFHK